MVMTDPISDMLTRIRNACQARHSKVSMPSSKLKENIAQLLYDEGYIRGYKVVKDERGHLHLEVYLKYTEEGEPVISNLKRVSKPGLRIYKKAEELPRVRSGLGVAVISTNKGLLSDRAARKENVGGEVLFYIW